MNDYVMTNSDAAVLRVTKPRTIAFYGNNGKPVLEIDTEARVITVPSDVAVNEAAQAVIEAMRAYLRGLDQGGLSL